jgi:hypothetical protein
MQRIELKPESKEDHNNGNVQYSNVVVEGSMLKVESSKP